MPEINENKVEYGLSNVHYAVITVGVDGAITYGTPKPIPGAVSLTMDKSGDMVRFKADDIDYYVAPNNQGYEGTLSIARVPDQFKIDVLGETKTENGVMVENVNAKSHYFALLFEFQGDAKGVRRLMYYCSADRPSVASTTKDSGEPNTSDLAIVAGPRPDNKNVKADTRNDVAQEVYDAWYDSVYEVPAATPPEEG